MGNFLREKLGQIRECVAQTLKKETDDLSLFVLIRHDTDGNSPLDQRKKMSANFFYSLRTFQGPSCGFAVFEMGIPQQILRIGYKKNLKRCVQLFLVSPEGPMF